MTPLLRCRRHRPRGAVLLMFLLVGLPMLWLCGALAVDFTRIILAQRQAGQIADSASVAGAFQTLANTPDNPYNPSADLDAAKARQVALDTIARSVQANVGRQLHITSSDVVVSNPPVGASTPATVTVTINYDVDDLVFLGIVDAIDPGAQVAHGTMVRTAFVCTPGTSLTFNGACSRPTGV